MELKVFEVKQSRIAEIISNEVVINNPQDALDVIAEAGAQGAQRIILYEQNMPPAFFDLQTRLAGEVLQKHANYRVKVAIVGEFEKFNSKSLRAFILESNRGNLVFFVPDRETAIARLTRG
jgi:hypothetical protein